jgi:flagellar basal body P-ring formation protein FlgA
VKCRYNASVICAVICSSLSLAVLAQNADVQSPAALQAAVRSFLEQQTAGQAAEVQIKVSDPDPRFKLPACVHLEAFLPSGSRLTGRTLVGVRCTEGTHWQVFLGAEVRLHAAVWVASRPLPAGSQVSATDLRQETVDITTFSSAVVMQPEQALGKTLSRPVAAGLPLRLDALKSADTLAAGDAVRVDCVGPGFKVSSDGKAVGSANPGQSVQVRMPSGQILSGIVKPGKVVELQI